MPELLAIYNEAILTTTATYDTEPESLAQRRAWLDARRAQLMPVLVAEREGVLLGFAALAPHSAKPGYRHTVMDSVYVGSASRGLGVGTLLLGALLRRARELGAHVVIASVDAENEPSLRLHRKLGFRKVAHLHEVGWKFGRWLDVVYLQLTLPQEEASSRYARRAPARRATA